MYNIRLYFIVGFSIGLIKSPPNEHTRSENNFWIQKQMKLKPFWGYKPKPPKCGFSWFLRL